jgi:hypothetical protein
MRQPVWRPLGLPAQHRLESARSQSLLPDGDAVGCIWRKEIVRLRELESKRVRHALHRRRRRRRAPRSLLRARAHACDRFARKNRGPPTLLKKAATQ